MKTVLERLAGGVLLVVVAAVLGLVGLAHARWDRTFDAPRPTLRASADPAVIARGRYLAYGPANCAACHTTKDQADRLAQGEEPALSGGHEWKLPVGTFRSANITPDAETGIGRYSDEQLVRMIRYGVRHDGRAALPFMAFQNLSDEDVVALVSFLRAQQPVRHAVPAHEPNLLGKAILATVIEPQGPKGTPPARSPVGATVERGEYLVNSVADCAGCHTKRSMVDGSAAGPLLAGGGEMPYEGDESKMLVTPNLTPDPKTGHIARWTEDQFVARFRQGRLLTGSYMPWASFSKMSDDDLRAIYRYLRSLPPVEHATGPIVQEKK